MTTTWTITGVQGPDGRGILTVLYRDDTGEQRGHRLPADTLGWRAAEYGIDPADTAALLDVVLHEPFITSADWTGPTHTPGADHEHPHFLYNCPDVNAARAHHLGRIATAKARHTVTDPHDMLRPLRDAHAAVLATGRHERQREHVVQMRAAIGRQRAGAP